MIPHEVAIYVCGGLLLGVVLAGLAACAWRQRAASRAGAHPQSGRFSFEPFLQASLLKQITDGMVALDPQQQVLDLSPQLEPLLGVAREQACGQPLAAIAPLLSEAVVCAANGLEQTIGLADKQGGQLRHFDVRVSPLVNATGQEIGLLLTLHDISQRMRTEEALRASEAQLRASEAQLRASEAQWRALVDHSPLALIAFSPEGNILEWNPAAERIYGWSAGEVLGLPLPTVPDEYQVERLRLQEQVNRGESIAYREVQRRRKDGAVIYVGLSVAPLTDAQGKIYAQMSVSADITERKQAQADLLRQEQALTVLCERERLSRELHDGLGQMLGYLNVQAQATQRLVAQGQYLAAQSNLRQMAKTAQETHANLRSHILGLRTPGPVENNLLHALRALLDQFAENSGIAVTLSLPQDAPATVFLPAVEEQVFRIIQEALVNVRRHSGARRVEVLFSFTSADAQIVITDDGAGFVPPAAQALVSPNGGFGLAIMRERAEQIGGSFEVRSAPGHGAQIWVHVPRLAPHAAPVLPEDLAILEHTRVLLVDDHPLFLDGMRSLLRSRGITVVGTAADGLEAQAKAHSLQPDVIVMDVEMPRCNGVEATRRIKAELPGVKILMLTVSEVEETLFAALRNGAAGYLLKNLDANQFCQYLADVVRGEVAIPPALAARMLGSWAEQRPVTSGARVDSTLTPQQWTILNLVAQGKLYKEVAADLNLSERTIKYHMGQILERLHLETREQAVAYALRSNGG